LPVLLLCLSLTVLAWRQAWRSADQALQTDFGY